MAVRCSSVAPLMRVSMILPGTALKDGAGHTVYTPPQDPTEIITLMSALERFISRFPLKLVHVHANNHALINGSRTPLVIECTFSASQPTGEPGTATLPHPLDMPNKRNRAEIAIRFE